MKGEAGAQRAVSATAAWAVRIGPFVFCAFPLYWMLVSSLKVSYELLASPPTFNLRAVPETLLRDDLGAALLVPVLRSFADGQEPARFEIVTTHSRDALTRWSSSPPTPVQLVSRPASRRNPAYARFADAVVAEGRALVTRLAGQ